MKRNTDSVRIEIPRPITSVVLKRDEKMIGRARKEQTDFTRIHEALAAAGVPHETSEAVNEAFIIIGRTHLYFNGWAHKREPKRFRFARYFVSR